MAVLYAYKGALLLFGVYMAWGTRRVKIAALSDSKYIAMNIYNVVLASVTVVAVGSVLDDRPTLSYAVIGAVLLLSTTLLLGLLFLPKVPRWSPGGARRVGRKAARSGLAEPSVTLSAGLQISNMERRRSVVKGVGGGGGALEGNVVKLRHEEESKVAQ